MVLRYAICFLVLLGTTTTINADVVELQWVTTVQSVSGLHPGIVGEQVTTTIEVDNGGTSIISQTWTANDFVSYRAEGASGWFFDGNDIDTFSSINDFMTDAGGNVVSAGDWRGNYPADTVNTSWDGINNTGGWWNNGGNEIHAVQTDFASVFVDNVSDNQIGSSWNASLQQVPEPGSFAMLTGCLATAACARRRRR